MGLRVSLEIYLRMDGIAGSAKTYAYRDWSPIRSWHWGLARTRRSQNGSSSEVININQITLIKPIGIESPMLMNLFAQRTIVQSADISVAHPAAKREAQQKLIDVNLNKILIQSIDTDVSTDESELLETVVIRFNQVKYDYFHTERAQQGGTGATTTCESFCWEAQNANSR